MAETIQGQDVLRRRFALGISERARRRYETLRMFRPLPHQERVFKSTASELVVRGGNRSGKTVCTSAEIGSAATGTDLHDHKGKLIPFKYPKDRPLTIWLIGYGENHIGDTFHRLLFRRNPEMRMIRDLETDMWRAYRPWSKADSSRLNDSRMAPPIIPARIIENWAWKDKSKRHFNICRLKPRAEFGKDSPGTVIHAFTSKGEPKMGDPVDIVWIDERIMFAQHYTEWQARIADRNGRIIWSVWPGNVNEALSRLIDRAQDEKEKDVEEVVLRHSENVFITKKQREKVIRSWLSQGGEEEVRSRNEGELVYGKQRVYPTFSDKLHRTPPMESDDDDKIDKAIRKNQGKVPKDWMRVMVLDPGHAHPGMLFLAVPPPSLCPDKECHAVVYDETYAPDSDADRQVTLSMDKFSGVTFETFFIDSHAARHTPMGFNKTVREQYTDTFRRHNVQSRTTGNSFRLASDDVDAGISLVRQMLAMQAHGRPRLRCIPEYTPNFNRQMVRYQKRISPQGHVEDKPAARQIDPMCDCVRYFACAQPTYKKPPGSTIAGSSQYRYFQSMWRPSGEKKDKAIYAGAGAR